jgi:hypothetical protein
MNIEKTYLQQLNEAMEAERQYSEQLNETAPESETIMHSPKFNKVIHEILNKVYMSLPNVEDNNYRKAQYILGCAAACLNQLQNYVNHVGQNTDEWLAKHSEEADKYLNSARNWSNKL